MLAGLLDLADVTLLTGIEIGFKGEVRHTDDGVHWRADLVTHIRKKFRFHARGIFRHFLGSQEFRLRANTFGDIAEGDDRANDFVGFENWRRCVFDGNVGPVFAPKNFIGDHARDAIARAQVHFAFFAGVPGAIRAGIMNLRVHLLSDECFRFVTQHFGSSGIHESHQAIDVEPADAFSNRSQNETGTLFDVCQSLCLLFGMLQQLPGLDVRG